MNDICGCPFSGITVEELAILNENELVTLATKMIPIFLESERYEKKSGKYEGYEKIIRIAVLLPSSKKMKEILKDNEQELALGTEMPFENLRDTVNAIRVSLSQLIKGESYKCSPDIRKALLMVIDKHSNKEAGYWTDELLKTLSDNKKFGGRINLWLNYFKEIEELIKVFNLPKEKIKEIFREVLKKNEKLEDAYFWTQYFSKVKDIAKIFDLSGEAREMFEGIIERNKKESPDACIEIAVEMGILINPQEFLEIADGLLKKANEEESESWRDTRTCAACRAYKGLKEIYQFGGREKILEKYGNSILNDRGINKVIKTASKVIGFKYEKQGFRDIHIGW